MKRAWTLVAVLALAGAVTWGQQAGAPATKKAEKPRTAESAVTPEVHSPKRHDEFMKAKVGNGFDLLFIGDSITDFWPTRGTSTWEKFAPYRPLNFGVSGDR